MIREILPVGAKVGKWTVLVYYPVGSRHTYKCRCDCGKESKVDAHALEKGRSVGCVTCRNNSLREIEEAKRKALLGSLCGAWTIVALPGRSDNGKALVTLQCVCGKEKTVEWRLNRKSLSCGCLPRKYVSGSEHGRAKLTEKEVIVIKSFLKSNLYKSSELAKMFGVTYRAIELIESGKNWKNVKLPKEKK